MTKNKLISGVRGIFNWAVLLLLALLAQSLPAASNSTNLPPIVLQTNTPVSQVKFRNGDTLQGGLLAIDAEKQLHWTNPAIRPVMKFPVSDVTKVRLAPAPKDAEKARGLGNCALRLLSGDQFTGNLIAMDDEQVLLDTWYAGQMKFPREQVRWLRSLDAGAFVYQGPTGVDGWTISASVDQDSQPAWGYSRGAFFSRQAGGIGRDLKLPDRAALDFDVNWEQYLQLTITIYTESLQVYRLPTLVGGVVVGAGGALVVQQNAQAQGTNPQPGAGFYAVHLNGTGAYLMTVRKNGDVSNSPVESIPTLGQLTRARISLRVDKIQKTISLLIDGKLAKTWKEEGEFAGRGTGVRFVQQGANEISLSHLSVGPWDGKLDTSLASLAGGDDPLEKMVIPASGTNDIFQLKNQDSFLGTLDHIRDGSLFVKTSFGSINFPLERVTEIDLATAPKTKAPKPAAGSVRAFFADTDGRATFEILEWDQGKVIASSPIFGRVQFNPAAFSLIDFEPTTRR